MGVPRIPITASADKYHWDPIPPVVYGGGIELRQVSDRVFMLIGLRQNHLRHQDFLKGQLIRYAPIGLTRRLRASYDVYPMEYQAGLWALIITNRMTYFKFAYHFYRGEIKWNKIFRRDFIQQAVNAMLKRIPGIGKPNVSAGTGIAEVPTSTLAKPKLPKQPVSVVKKPAVKKVVKKEIKEVKPIKPVEVVKPKPKLAPVPKPKPIPKPVKKPPVVPEPKKPVGPTPAEKRLKTQSQNKVIENLDEVLKMQNAREALERLPQTAKIRKEIADLRVKAKVLADENKILKEFFENDVPLPSALKSKVLKRKPKTERAPKVITKEMKESIKVELNSLDENIDKTQKRLEQTKRRFDEKLLKDLKRQKASLLKELREAFPGEYGKVRHFFKKIISKTVHPFE